MTSRSQHNGHDPRSTELCSALDRLIAHQQTLPAVFKDVEELAQQGALLLSRRERLDTERRHYVIERTAAIRWFTDAAAFLYELRIPKGVPEHVAARLRLLRQRCLQCSFPRSLEAGPTEKDVESVVSEARQLRSLLQPSQPDDQSPAHTQRSRVDQQS